MTSVYNSQSVTGSRAKQQEFKDFLDDSGIVKCITVAFDALFSTRPKVEDGLAEFQRMMAKSYIIELESERKRCQDLTNQINLLHEEHMGLIKQLEQLKISNLDLKKQRKTQKKQNHEIKKQLKELRRELREVNPSSSLLPILSDTSTSASSEDSDSVSPTRMKQRLMKIQLLSVLLYNIMLLWCLLKPRPRSLMKLRQKEVLLV